MWHGKCYWATDNGELPIARLQDEEREFLVQDNDEEGHFLSARDGDNLITPFQCDHCHFMNLMGREPLENLASDVRLLKCIRRVNLDAFWSREPGAVQGVLGEAKREIAIASSLGFAHSLFQSRGSWDCCCYYPALPGSRMVTPSCSV